MAADPARERNAAFVHLSALLRARGITVPRVIAADQRRGLFLLEDLGRRHVADAVGLDRQRALDRAVAGLAHWQRSTRDLASRGPHYSRARFEFELSLFEQHFCDALPGAERPPDWPRWRSALVAHQCLGERVLVHRDWHGRNLLEQADGRLGVVDFQDAVAGPLCYDIASLLHDLYAPLEPPQARQCFQQWLEATRANGIPLPDAPWQAMQRSAQQRLLKILGQFARLHRIAPALPQASLVPKVAERVAAIARTLDEAALADWFAARSTAWTAAVVDGAS